MTSSSAKCGAPCPGRPPPPPPPRLWGSPPRPPPRGEPPPPGSAAAARRPRGDPRRMGRGPRRGGPHGAAPKATRRRRGGGGSPTSPRFRDPLLLLGLAAGGGDPDFFPRPPWSPLLAHYDVQSILFDPSEPPPGPPGLISGASAAHLEPEEPPGSPRGAPEPEALVLSCPRFCCDTGGEREPGSPRGPPGPGQLPNAAVAVLEEPPAGARPPYPIEHSDEGADYYRKYFYGKEHHNLLGEDPRLGPVAVSLRREEKDGPRPQVLHRIILRTCQLRALRGSVLEEALPPGCRPPGPRAAPPRKLLELLLPGLELGGLRLAPHPSVQDSLLRLDEQGVSRQRKVGVLYCRAGQGSEEEMYNNERAGPAFEQFLALLGTRVRLRGFGGYRAQLDTRTDSTGTHSLYATYHGHEVMFHVSTMLPFTPRNPQQLLRKRHIGNDIVTIVFQEPGARPFSPRALRSHFQHVFIVVRAHQPCTPRTKYSVAVVRPEDTPRFGPAVPGGPRFLGGSGLRPFLLAAAINGENAAARGGRLGAMAARTRRLSLRELLRAHPAGPAPPATPRGLPTLGALLRGGSASGVPPPGGAVVAGAVVWGARVECGGLDGGHEWGGHEWGGPDLPCLLGVAAERIVVVAAPPRVGVADGGVGHPQSAAEGSEGSPQTHAGPLAGGRTLFSCACRDVLGWSFSEGRLEIFHGEGEWIALRLPRGTAPRVVSRLQAVTRGCEAQELSVPRGAGGRRGFRVDPSGVVTAVSRFSFAETAGLRRGARLLRLGRRPLPRGDPRALRALLRSPAGPLTLLPPERDGRPRRSFSELYARALEQGRGSGGDPHPGDPHPGDPHPGDPHPGGDIGDSSSDSGGDSDTGEPPKTPPSPPRPPDPKTPGGGTPRPSPRTDPTPDLLLPLHCPPPPGDTGPPPDPDPASGPARRHSVGSPLSPPPPALSGFGDPQDEEWERISGLATACRGVLEAIARGGQQLRELPRPDPSPAAPEEGSQRLSEKVAQLEAALRRLQEGHEEQQQLRAELRRLRRDRSAATPGDPRETPGTPPGDPLTPLGTPDRT
ncbi:signal-induced proliferation-associated protein 1 [Taeniopygia guttata]|uniref:signal-induced proliferation-associated protein 1 n=1 Tax=Taeniopygia guttata TaxID=59729 RepID=UPI003BB98ACB